MIAEIVTHASQSAVESGLGLGSVMAVTCSWTRNRSILAALFSWFYVIYFAMTRRPDEMRRK